MQNKKRFLLLIEVKMFLNPKNKQTEKFIFSRFISSTIAFGVLHTSLICCVLIQYFKDAGMSPMQLSIIIISKRVLRLFCDTFFGLIFDRFGAKLVFILGRSLKLISYFILLFFPSFEGFVVAMLLDGASYSSIYGKISSYIYNNLSVRQKLKLFPRAMSLYYFCMDTTVAMMTFFAGILLKTHGYDMVIYVSILINIFSIFLLIKFVPSRQNELLISYHTNSFKEIFMTLISIIKTKPQFLYLIGFYGVVSFLAWQFHSISSLILLDMNVSSVNVAMYGAILKITMGFGALISIFFFPKGAQLYNCAYFLLLSLVFGEISAIMYNKDMFYIFCLLIVGSYTITEISIEKNFEYYSDKTVRGTAISLAMTFCSFIAIFSNFLVGIIAQKYNYKMSLIILIAVLIVFALFLILKFLKTKDLNIKYE